MKTSHGEEKSNYSIYDKQIPTSFSVLNELWMSNLCIQLQFKIMRLSLKKKHLFDIINIQKTSFHNIFF